jgi:hypothetical protein
MSHEEAWYVVKQPNGSCEIRPDTGIETSESDNQTPDSAESWGPFSSRSEAIARRVGLIRAGKCQPL